MHDPPLSHMVHHISHVLCDVAYCANCAIIHNYFKYCATIHKYFKYCATSHNSFKKFVAKTFFLFRHSICTLQRSSWTYTDQDSCCLSLWTLSNIWINWISKKYIFRLKESTCCDESVPVPICRRGWGQTRKQDVQGARLQRVSTWASFS